MMLRRDAFAVSFLLLSGSAWAFDYGEHFRLTQHTLEQLPTESVSSGQLMGALAAAFPGDSRLCSALEEEKAGAHCLRPGDLTALAGDHGQNPPALYARWVATSDAQGGLLLRNLFAGLDGLGTPGASRGVCSMSRPDFASFLKIVRPSCLGEADESPTADTLASVDGDYLCLAEHNETHFRMPGVSMSAQARSELPSAPAAYAQYHGQALEVARLSARQPRLLGLAMFLELFALHFLQDAVAAGHIVTPRSSVTDGTALSTHAHYNRVGIMAELPPGVCPLLKSTGARLPRLERFCATSKQRPVRVRGDGALLAKLDRSDPQDVTFDLATLVGIASIREMTAALTGDATPIASPPCETALVACLDAGAPNAFGCLATWSGPACFQVYPGRAASDLELLVPLTLLPAPTAPVDLKEYLTGRVVSLSYRHRAVGGSLDAGLAWFTPPFGRNRFLLDLSTPVALPLGISGSASWIRGWFVGGIGASYSVLDIRSLSTFDIFGRMEAHLSLGAIPFESDRFALLCRLDVGLLFGTTTMLFAGFNLIPYMRVR